MEPSDELQRGRDAYARRAWGDAHAQLSAADRRAPLEPEDLERLAMAAYLIGRDTESLEILARAYHQSAEGGDLARAARCAFWSGYQLISKGDMAQAGGWFARGRRLLDDGQLDSVEEGYVLISVALQTLVEGDAASAYPIFGEAATVGGRFRDPDLLTLAGLGQGQALIALGKTVEGLTALDEIMVGVTTGEVSAIVAGLVYCAVIAACQEAFDLRRAQEWTEALSRWCGSQPDLVPYRGQCLVHRAQLMSLQGAWPEAMDEADRARETLSRAPDQSAVGMAFYELAELHRRRGDFEKADDAYRQANQWGHPPQPGLALMRLAQDRMEAAEAAIRRVMDEAGDLVTRAKLLPAHVEIMLAVGDVPTARAAADDLSEIARAFGAPLLDAVAGHSQGAVLLAEGDPRAASSALRHAWGIWQELEAPHEGARTRILMGLACRRLGDHDTATMELDAARLVFERLGAAPDLASVLDLCRETAPQAGGGLTAREVQVLGLVATGKSNRAIASELVISEKTVARHVSNIFTKLHVTSRAAATAYAYEHDLL